VNPDEPKRNAEQVPGGPDHTARPAAESTSGEAKQGASPAPALPTLSLPKGGGAIRGIGEKFAVNPATGTGKLSVPIAVSPGRSGFGPQLSLDYDSGSGNGPFGFGWSLGLPAITRKTDKGLPRYRDEDESDVFILAGAEDLVPVLDESLRPVRASRTVHGTTYSVRQYRPRIEGLFSRIELWVAHDTGLGHWRSISRDNVTTLYGVDASSRIASPDDPRHIFSYLISRTFDDKGNVAVYEYAAENDIGVASSQANEANRTTGERSINRYVKRIRYGGDTPYFPDYGADGAETPLPSEWHFEVVFDYGDHDLTLPTPRADAPWSLRPDPFSRRRAGFEVRTYRRCRRVLVFHHFPLETAVGADCLVRSTDFLYSDEKDPIDLRRPVYSLLCSVTQSGYRRLPSGGTYLRRALPPVEFDYTPVDVQARLETLDAESFANLPAGLNGYEWIDLDGEGLSSFVADLGGGAWGRKRNLSPLEQETRSDGTIKTRARFGALEAVASLPSRSDLGGGQQLLDLSGNGELNLVSFSGPLPGFFERTHDESWLSFRAFVSLPSLNWSDPNLKFVDLTGDGLADVLLTEDGLFTFYRSLGAEGFAQAQCVRMPWDEERGPRVVLSDAAQTILLADMSGDGLSDIVRVRNGDVSYWPNLGYGRFGSKVAMDRAPRFASEDEFDPNRVRLADVDGSGTTDLLYIGPDGVQVCFNQSGNAWASSQTLAVFPSADALSSVRAMDLLGNGTTCLVWSTPLPDTVGGSLRYVDLMGGQKPHLLVRSRNNLGAETRLSYAPSTRFYLADKAAGRPWVTRLPHVVHVVDRVETYDFIGRSRFVTRYAYHHGYFDGVEREFRGFGMVEQWDAEEHRDTTDFPQAAATNWHQTSWSPPVLTRTWFHTGACPEAGKLSRQYAHEYWVEPALRPDDRTADREAMQLSDSTLPKGLAPDEIHEAYRALKGMTLRTEVFAQDSSAHASNPYSVTEQNFAIRQLQPRGTNRYACFFAQPREHLGFDYERRPGDPRVTHEFTLEADDFGNVLRSASVGYPRRLGYNEPEPSLSTAFRAMLAYDQTRLHISATERHFTNAIGTGGPDPSRSALPAGDPRLALDAHRTPAPCEGMVAELTGLVPTRKRPGITNLFRFNELDSGWRTVWNVAHDKPSEEIPTSDIDGAGVPPAAPTRRIVQHTRTLYRSDDLSGLLPPGQVGLLALPGEAYHRAFSPGHVTRIFGAMVTDATLAEGGYVRLADGPDWWIPSGRVFYSSGDGETRASDIAQARAHFYLVRRAVDPFGAISRVSYDPYDLLVTRAVDALENTASAANDYRVLAPFLLTDANGNREEIAFDALGLVAGTAVMGKGTERLGDSLVAFDPDLDPALVRAHLADPLTNARSILGDASCRVIYDPSAYLRTQDDAQPAAVVVYSLTRDIHVSALPTGQVSQYQHVYSYRDGLGREVQRKTQAAPGLVPGIEDRLTSRWIGSGWAIFNNKGKPVRTYEPFFSATHDFEFAKRVGVSTVVFYDPVGRPVATLHPDDTWEKIVFDNWRQETWDSNDTVLIADPRTDNDVGDYFVRLLGRSTGAFTSWHSRRIGGAWVDAPVAAKRAAQKSERHAATPVVAHFDALGRTCLTVANNGAEGRYPTRLALDTQGKPLALLDALERRVFEYFLHEPLDGGIQSYVAGNDLIGNALCQSGRDGGVRRVLTDVAGNPTHGWDARGYRTRTEYDALHRPLRVFVMPPTGVEILAERVVYGEAGPDGGAASNLRGHKVLHYDGAGELYLSAYDFRGNLTTSTRRLATAYRQTPDWSAIAALADANACRAAAAPFLESEPFTTTTVYDALNRIVSRTAPDQSMVVPTYNEAGQLQRLEVHVRGAAAAIPFVQSLDYNARGQRARADYANGTSTAFRYDPLTFLLIEQVTSHTTNKWKLQHYLVTYDPVHNVAETTDYADQSLYFGGSAPVAGGGQYEYDAVYRLVSTTGREHPGQQMPDQTEGPLALQPHPNDLQAMRAYTELYRYDPVGNLTKVSHKDGKAGWTRHYEYASESNRLLRTSLPGDAAAGRLSGVYEHDAAGNMTKLPHIASLRWDHANRMVSADLGGGGTSYYTYDADGVRVRTVVERIGPTEERVYVGTYEISRRKSGATVDEERQTIHLMDDARRVAMVETLTVPAEALAAAPVSRLRYQVANHLNSACVELDDDGRVITYEEYFPFGATSFHSVFGRLEASAKRYRFTGKERDQETGFSYHAARYYVPWLARWTSCDPLGPVSTQNLFVYCRNNPVTRIDSTGLQDAKFDAIIKRRDALILSGHAEQAYEEDKWRAVGTAGGLAAVGCWLSPTTCGRIAFLLTVGQAKNHEEAAEKIGEFYALDRAGRLVFKGLGRIFRSTPKEPLVTPKVEPTGPPVPSPAPDAALAEQAGELQQPWKIRPGEGVRPSTAHDAKPGQPMVLDNAVTDRYSYVVKQDGTITYAPNSPQSAATDIVKHTDLAENGAARVSGEILYDRETGKWLMDQNSGRYSAQPLPGQDPEAGGMLVGTRNQGNVEAAAELARRSGTQQAIVAKPERPH
jgi:RHS repeat-associated protein